MPRKPSTRPRNWAWKPPYDPDQAINWPASKSQAILRLERENKRLRSRLNGKGDRRKQLHPFYDSARWRELRYTILKRDGARCALCGATARKGVILHVDHIIPRSVDPAREWDPDNLQVLCEACNLGKSNRDKTDFRSP